VEWIRSETGGFGADYTFEATGNVAVMRQAVEAAREAWGLATMCGVAGKGEVLEVVPRFLITGRRVTGSSFGGVKGRTQVPRYVERWLAGEIDVESLISHRLTLDEVNRGFELMEAPGRDQERDRVRMTIVLGVILSVVAFISARVRDRGIRLGGAQGRRGGSRGPTAYRHPPEDTHRPLASLHGPQAHRRLGRDDHRARLAADGAGGVRGLGGVRAPRRGALRGEDHPA
jgi:hypothetical protein